MRKRLILKTFFPSVFNSNPSCYPGTQLPKRKDREREQNKAPQCRGGCSGTCHTFLRHTQLCGVGWDSPKGAETPGGSAHCPSFTSRLGCWGGPSWPEVSNCDPYLQEGPEGESADLSASPWCWKSCLIWRKWGSGRTAPLSTTTWKQLVVRWGLVTSPKERVTG